MDRGIRADRRRAAGKDKVKVAAGDVVGIGAVGKAHLLGEGVGVQPVDQPLAPTGDDRGLGIVDVGVDEAGRDQVLSVIMHARAGMGRAQGSGLAHGGDAPGVDQNRAVGQMPGGIKAFERVALIIDHLSQKKISHIPAPKLAAPD